MAKLKDLHAAPSGPQAPAGTDLGGLAGSVSVPLRISLRAEVSLGGGHRRKHFEPLHCEVTLLHSNRIMNLKQDGVTAMTSQELSRNEEADWV